MRRACYDRFGMNTVFGGTHDYRTIDEPSRVAACTMEEKPCPR